MAVPVHRRLFWSAVLTQCNRTYWLSNIWLLEFPMNVNPEKCFSCKKNIKCGFHFWYICGNFWWKSKTNIKKQIKPKRDQTKIKQEMRAQHNGDNLLIEIITRKLYNIKLYYNYIWIFVRVPNIYKQTTIYLTMKVIFRFPGWDWNDTSNDNS